MRRLMAVLAVMFSTGAAVPAHADVVHFSFDGLLQSGGTILGTVTGDIYGLTANGANQQATDIVVTSYPTTVTMGSAPDGFGGTVPVPFQMTNAAPAPLDIFSNAGIAFNSFTLVGGVVTAASFYADNNSTTGNPYRSFWLNAYGYNVFSDYNANPDPSDPNTHCDLTGCHSGGAVESFGFSGVTYSTVQAVPEPDTYAMLLAGLGMIGFMARRNMNFRA